MSDIGALSDSLATAIADSAGLRNILVHEYNDIEHRYLYEAIGRCLAEYPQYVDALIAFLDSLETSHE